MQLLQNPNLLDRLTGKNLFVDATTLINASKSEDFLSLLATMSSKDCTILTIPSVVYEFTRNAHDIATLEERLNYISRLGIVVLNRVEELVSEQRIFAIAYSKQFDSRRQGPSYTDSLLSTLMYKFKASHPLLISANHKDMPLSMFDREELITIDNGREIHTEAIYSLSTSKLSKIIDSLSFNKR